MAKSVELTEPRFKEVVILYRSKSDPPSEEMEPNKGSATPEARKHSADSGAKPRNMHIKRFVDIPLGDADMVMPDKVTVGLTCRPQSRGFMLLQIFPGHEVAGAGAQAAVAAEHSFAIWDAAAVLDTTQLPAVTQCIVVVVIIAGFVGVIIITIIIIAILLLIIIITTIIIIIIIIIITVIISMVMVMVIII